MNIAVVTTVWGPYGRYIPDWLASVAAQTTPPAEVVVVDLGTDTDDVRVAVETSPLPVRYVKAGYEGMGKARNRAVAETGTEWVMHLDADDVLLPHAIEDAAILADECDVVSLGVLWDGRTRLFPHVSRETVLRQKLVCLSPSPYRRELWEQRPYIEVNDWIESALWVGFAHLGARFAATTRPGFVYRRHPDSHSATIPATDKAKAKAQLRRLCEGWDL